MPSREYSDSEEDAPVASTTIRPIIVGASSTPASPKAPTSGPRVKLTFRPNINHLVHNDPPNTSSSHSRSHSNPAPLPPSQSERSSLSPPPPLTLKIGPRTAMPGPSRPSQRIDYSDSSDDDDDDASRPPKKPKHNKPAQPAAAPPTVVEVAGAAPMRKSYDWLTPSAVGASHSGPPERSAEAAREKLGEEYLGQGMAEGKKAKSKVDRTTGRGKNWRKGVTKTMLGAMREADAFGHGTGVHGSYTPGDATPSLPASPDLPPQEFPPIPRDASETFIPAESAILGIPIFSKPIITPKLHYTLWPKVSATFSPINGGDVGPFPRKEPVRPWKKSQKVLVGIGGGSLKFKTWTRGPPSQLSLLVKADKEAKELLTKKPKPTTGTVTPAERPTLLTSISTDSVPSFQPAPAAIDQALEDVASEVGDVDDNASVVSNKEGTIMPQPSVVPAKRKAPKAPKAKVGPRKSKLAQEIHPIPDTAASAIEDIL